MRIGVTAAIIVFCMSMGCATASREIVAGHRYEDGYDYASYTSFDWLPEPGRVRVNEAVIGKIKELVEANLSGKGIRRVSAAPAFLIALHAQRQEKLDESFWGYEVRKRERRYGVEAQEFTYDEATLLLDFVDAGSKQMFWRGWARSVVDPGATPETRQQRLKEAVDKILSAFPPTR